MTTEKELVTIIRNWNPVTDSVKVLKAAFDQYDGTWYESDDVQEALMDIPWFEKYFVDPKYSGVTAVYSIITTDFEGNCICGDFDEVQNIDELVVKLREWQNEQQLLHDLTKMIVHPIINETLTEEIKTHKITNLIKLRKRGEELKEML